MTDSDRLEELQRWIAEAPSGAVRSIQRDPVTGAYHRYEHWATKADKPPTVVRGAPVVERHLKAIDP